MTFDSDIDWTNASSEMLGAMERDQEYTAWRRTRDGLEVLANVIRNARGHAWTDEGNQLMASILAACETGLGECASWERVLDRREG